MTVPNALGADDATPEAYRKFITRMCRPDFEQMAWKVISDGVHRNPDQPPLTAQQAAQLPTWRAQLPRRSGGDATALLGQSVVQTEQDVANPAAKAERERIKAEEMQRAQAALNQAGAAYAQDLVNSAVTQSQPQPQAATSSPAVGSEGSAQGTPEAQLCSIDADLCPKTAAQCIETFCALDPRSLRKDEQCVSNCNARPGGRGQ
jgi:hypothetical protein